MIIENYVFDIIDSNMYVCVDDNYAIIIDPFESEELKAKLLKNKVEYIFIILTHEHIDHISGANFYTEFTTTVCCSEECKYEIDTNLRKLKLQFASIFIKENQDIKIRVRHVLKGINKINIDRVLRDEEIFYVGKHKVLIRNVCGHTKGSIIIIMDDKIVFTGDSLMTDRDVVTNLPGGDIEAYEAITVPILKQLDGNLIVYPGHGRTQKLSTLRGENKNAIIR